jgi:hypothetical protein
MLLIGAGNCLRAGIPPEALKGYRAYVSNQEARIKEQNQSGSGFLWSAQDSARRKSVRSGEIPVEKRRAPEIPKGLINHWIGAVFLPGVTIDQVKRLDQNYNQYKIFYHPDIQDSKLLSHDGDHFKVFYRFKKTKILTVVLDTIHEIDFSSPAPQRLIVTSRCDDVREVKDPGSAERVLPVGEGRGFMWAMNSYWRMEEGEGGVVSECEAITLARSIPFGLSAVIGPVVESMAEDSLRNTLTAKRRVASKLQR